jgi:trehalose 6-phosphate phosphatase
MKSCLTHWPEIAARIHAARGVFVAFDYDGVLAPIAARPELARIPAENRALLDRLAKHAGMHVAVVSGRALADVRRQVNLESLLYAGNHGAEIALDGTAEQHIPLERYRQALVDVYAQLSAWLKLFPGLRLEDKGFGIGLHYREVPAEQLPVLHDAFALWANGLPEELAVFPAKMMMEVRPKVEWNKGSAVLRIWEAVAPASLPFCLGDDRTDEDGFIALKGKGINIFVGTAKESCAEFFLESTDEVTLFLQRLLTEADARFK